jgi:HK97 family phage major capsid protein
MADWIAALRAGRPAADRCQVKALPPGTDVINLPKIATGTATAIQSANAGAVTSVDLTTATVSGPVRTIAGQQDISLQLLEQSPSNFDEIVFQDLLSDYNRQLDAQVLSGSGASGQLTGLLTLSGTNAVTFTQATPTVPLLYAPLGQAASQVAKLRFLTADTILMHPSHWWWIASALDTQNRPLVEPEGGVGVNTVAVLDPFAAQGVAGSIAGIPVVVDANVPTNLGAGTNQAPILVGRFSDFYLYEGAIRLRALPEILSGTLQMRLQAYNYMAFIAGRYPTALSVINGTGCIVPAGF